MNKETYNKLIANPGQIESKHKSDLKELVNQFPYCQSVQLSYLTSLYKDEDLLFESELKKTALKIANRELLRKMFVPNKAQEYYFDRKLEVVDNDLHPDDPKSLEEEKENIIIEPALKVVTESSEEKTEESKPDEKALKTTKDSDKQESLIPELDQQILSSAVSASISLDVDDLITEPDNEEKIKTEEASLNSEHKKNIGSESSSKLSFTGWLDQIESIADLEGESEFRKKAAQIVDQFIQTQPKIIAKTEFYSPINMARKSIEESDDIVSETLAKIYAAQGNTKKAIESYEKLCLKFPEKKAYFASLIEELKKD